MNAESIKTSALARGDRSGTEAPTSACWYCGCTDFERLFDAGDFDTALDVYPIRRCQQCALAYTGQVTEEVLADSYAHSYYGSEKAKFLSLVETLVRTGHRLQAKKILAQFRRDHPEGEDRKSINSVLDIGCGRALLLQEFSKLGVDCVGIERSEYPGTNSSNIAIHTGALHDVELSDKRFDVVILWHVLEHITELGTLFEELPKHLNPGGLLVISVPNFLSWQSRFFKQHWFHLDLPRHVTHFDKAWLEKNLTLMGFEILSINSFTASQNIYGFIQSSLNKLVPRYPNRLYKLLTQSNGRRNWLALVGWAVMALPLTPFALLESLLTEKSHKGATLTLYARYLNP